MSKPEKLYKTTIVIWSEYSPAAEGVELDTLARDAMSGESYCGKQVTECVTDSAEFPETEFFDCPE
jgi:hypothetical protein